MNDRKTERILSIDILRGFALIFMVLVHFVVYWGDKAAVNTWPYFFLNHVMADWGATCFLMMMGMSQVFSSHHRAGEGRFPAFKRALIRGGFIFMAGICMLALAWGPGKIWEWDILTLMGFATVMLFFCRLLPSWSIMVVVVCLGVCTPLLRGSIDFNAVWGGGFVDVPVISRYLTGILLDPAKEYEVVWRTKEIIQGFLFTGDFPVMPWLIFPLLGFVLGRRIVGGKIQHDLPLLAIIGSLFAALGLGWAYAALGRNPSAIITGYIAPLSFYPDSFTMICYQLGVALVVFSGLFYAYDVRKPDKSKVGFFARIFNLTSRSSLTFYFLHYLLIGWPLALIYVLTGKYCKYALLGAYHSLLAGIGAVIILVSLLAVWGRSKNKYSLEWCLDKLIKRYASS
jgi:uncharacterized membrane protein